MSDGADLNPDWVNGFTNDDDADLNPDWVEDFPNDQPETFKSFEDYMAQVRMELKELGIIVFQNDNDVMPDDNCHFMTGVTYGINGKSGWRDDKDLRASISAHSIFTSLPLNDVNEIIRKGDGIFINRVTDEGVQTIHSGRIIEFNGALGIVSKFGDGPIGFAKVEQIVLHYSNRLNNGEDISDFLNFDIYRGYQSEDILYLLNQRYKLSIDAIV